MSEKKDFSELPEGLPVPVGDGGCDHLKKGVEMPEIVLYSHRGEPVNIKDVSVKEVFFFYPRTGRPDVPSPVGWDQIPGARGCTPESCSYRDMLGEFRTLGFEVFGVSTQSSEEKREFAQRKIIPYQMLSDADLRLTNAMKLPTFSVEGIPTPLIKRITLVTMEKKIDRRFYPVFPPDRNASDVLDYLRR